MEGLITVDKLQEKLNKRENVFILDVRPNDQRSEWSIAGSHHVDAYTQLNAGDYSVLNDIKIPEKTIVVTVCSAGRTSLIASKALREKGVNAYSLLGGMKAWNYAWNTAVANFKDSKVIQMRRAAKGVISYIVGSGNDAVVVDAALNPQVYQTIAEENGWRIKYVIDTHVHADYVSRTRELANHAGATNLMIDAAMVAYDYIPVPNGGIIRFGNEEIKFMHTPGHTWESATLKLGDSAILTGDTLFIDGIGRSDLIVEHAEAVKKAKALYKSLHQLLKLNGEIMVLPAHASNAIKFDNKVIGDTINNIKSQLWILNLSEAGFVEFVLSRIPPTPPNYLTIASINRSGSSEGQVLADLEAGGNHCAIA